MVLRCLGGLPLRYGSLPLQHSEHSDTSKDSGCRKRPPGYYTALAKLVAFNGFCLVDAHPDVGAFFLRESLRPRQQPPARAVQLHADQ